MLNDLGSWSLIVKLLKGVRQGLQTRLYWDSITAGGRENKETVSLACS